MIDLGEGRNDWMTYLDLEYTYEFPGSMTVFPEPSQCMSPATTGLLLQLSYPGGCCSLPRWRLPLPTKRCIHGGNRWVCKTLMCTSSKRVHIEGMEFSWTWPCLWPGWTYPLPAADLVHTLRKDPDSFQNACPCSHSWKGARPAPQQTATAAAYINHCAYLHKVGERQLSAVAPKPPAPTQRLIKAYASGKKQSQHRVQPPILGPWTHPKARQRLPAYLWEAQLC